jgi:hypothetical protein
MKTIAWRNNAGASTNQSITRLVRKDGKLPHIPQRLLSQRILALEFFSIGYRRTKEDWGCVVPMSDAAQAHLVSS